MVRSSKWQKINKFSLNLYCYLFIQIVSFICNEGVFCSWRSYHWKEFFVEDNKHCCQVVQTLSWLIWLIHRPSYLIATTLNQRNSHHENCYSLLCTLSRTTGAFPTLLLNISSQAKYYNFSKVKYLINYWMNCHAIFYNHSWSPEDELWLLSSSTIIHLSNI